MSLQITTVWRTVLSQIMAPFWHLNKTQNCYPTCITLRKFFLNYTMYYLVYISTEPQWVAIQLITNLLFSLVTETLISAKETHAKTQQSAAKASSFKMNASKLTTLSCLILLEFTWGEINAWEHIKWSYHWGNFPTRFFFYK